jgi:ABC-type sugar transport system permease subunit
MSLINEICLLASIFIVLNVLFTTTETSIFNAGATGSIIATILSAILSFSLFITMRKKQMGKSNTHNWAAPYYFMLPAVLVLVLVVAFPLIYGFYLSMTNMSLSSFRNPQLIWFNNRAKNLNLDRNQCFLPCCNWLITRNSIESSPTR